MRETTPSKTAAWVAACRAGLGVELPPGTKLCDDPYGMLFAGLPTTGLGAELRKPIYRVLLRQPSILRFVLWMQLRTRYLDDVLLHFLRGGGRQVVILGAGFDARALRFASELREGMVYEVDHPATQSYKLQVLNDGRVPPARAQHVPIDFEKQSAHELPSLLAKAGHDPCQPTLTIWEGVTMYLTPQAIEATVAAIRDYSSPGSVLAFTYFDLARMKRSRPQMLITAAVVKRYGEPWRFGWDPQELPRWLEQRGLRLRENVSEVDIAQRYLPPQHARRFSPTGRYIAVAEVENGAGS